MGMGTEQLTRQSIYTASALQIVLLCVHTPRGLSRVPFSPHPPPLGDGNPSPAALLRPYLGILACAIEVQHNNENPTTVYSNDLVKSTARKKLGIYDVHSML